MDIQTFDTRQPVAVDDPSGIRPDDWLEDLGTLRQVDYVDTLSAGIGPGTLTIVHFKPQVGVPNLPRGITGGRSLTVWRTQLQPEDRALPEQEIHAEA
jgi:hypothetical protein